MDWKLVFYKGRGFEIEISGTLPKLRIRVSEIGPSAGSWMLDVTSLPGETREQFVEAVEELLLHRATRPRLSA